MEGEFINCVYYKGGEDDFKGDFIDTTLAIHDDLTVEMFADNFGIIKVPKGHRDYDEELVNTILQNPESYHAAVACEELLNRNSLYKRVMKLYRELSGQRKPGDDDRIYTRG